ILVALGAAYFVLLSPWGMNDEANQSAPASAETETVAQEIEAFSTTDLTVELDQIEQEMAQ
ncbi:MAG: hypothetical protein MN733_24990, partial [Nitrososphaera sp.]|nr:hypothetical protein [Nitrososphaera sp.]